METIYDKLEKSIREANIPGIRYKKDYPRDFVLLTQNPVEDEEVDTLTPLIKAMSVLLKTLRKEASQDDDIEVTFYHLPVEETWGISIGDGR